MTPAGGEPETLAATGTGCWSPSAAVWERFSTVQTEIKRRLHKWSERERIVLFNDALNTFYLRLYGVRHMVKDHSDS